jgi:ribosomal-protein-alanine N-acetyltransferase
VDATSSNLNTYVAVEANWEGFPEVIRFLTEANRPEALSEWGLYLVFDDDGVLVGNAGWKGEPINGAAELGYAVAPSRQGRGIATAVVRELVTRAVAAGLREVIAHTRAAESPSTSVLCQHIEEFDGRVIMSEFAHHRLLDRVRDLMDRLYQLDPEWTEKD